MQGQTVLSDPQYGITRILRPYSGFEAIYEGIAANRPIMLTEGGIELDQRAISGADGYSPNLVRGLPVALGQQVILYLPKIHYRDPPSVGAYIWFIAWRLRGLGEYITDKITPYHLPKSGFGQPDTSVVPPVQRYVVPVASESVSYIQSEPGDNSDRATDKVFPYDTEIASGLVNLPLRSSGAGASGVFQQGVIDPATSPTLSPRDFFLPIKRRALGDELLIGLYRRRVPFPSWQFASVDLQLSNLLGIGHGQEFPNIGVYVIPGVD